MDEPEKRLAGRVAQVDQELDKMIRGGTSFWASAISIGGLGLGLGHLLNLPSMHHT